MSSIRNFEDAGKISPATRFTTITQKLTASTPRRGLIRNHTSGRRSHQRPGFVLSMDWLNAPPLPEGFLPFLFRENAEKPFAALRRCPAYSGTSTPLLS
jgi:hypothetical protein